MGAEPCWSPRHGFGNTTPRGSACGTGRLDTSPAGAAPPPTAKSSNLKFAFSPAMPTLPAAVIGEVVSVAVATSAPFTNSWMVTVPLALFTAVALTENCEPRAGAAPAGYRGVVNVDSVPA